MSGNLEEETIKLLLESQKLEEMSKISKRDYNLPVNIWIDEEGIDRKVEHNIPRLKVQNNYSDRTTQNDFISVSIDNNPQILAGTLKIKQKDLNKVFEFIKLNYSVLMDRWNNKITTKEMFYNLKDL